MKRADSLAPLRQVLGRRPPAGLASLSPETLEEIELAVRDARERQARALADSLEASLKLAPRPLRPLLRKVLVG